MSERAGAQGIAAWRFRTGVVLMALGGVAYLAAHAATSDALFALALAAVAAGLIVHLTDPVVLRAPVTVVALLVAIAGAGTDAVLAANGETGPASAVAVAALVAGVAVAAASRKLGPMRS